MQQNACNPPKNVYNTRQRKLGRAVECTGLENRRGFVAHREFESLSFRHYQNDQRQYVFGHFLLSNHLSDITSQNQCYLAVIVV